MGVLITAAFGLDRSWANEGYCRSWASTEAVPSPWQFDPKQVVVIERSDGTKAKLFGHDMVRLALLDCRQCPAQYRCAEYAVRAQMVAGTWAMRIADLRWLRKQPEAIKLVEAWEEAGVPVQVAVREARGLS